MTPNEERLRACLAKMEPHVYDAFLTVLNYLAASPVKLSPSEIVTLVNSELEAQRTEEVLAKPSSRP